MHPRHVVTRLVRRRDFSDDLVQRHRRGVDHRCAFRCGRDDLFGNQRPGIKAHRAFFDQSQAAHGDQVGRARPGADEVNRHEASCHFFA